MRLGRSSGIARKRGRREKNHTESIRKAGTGWREGPDVLSFDYCCHCVCKQGCADAVINGVRSNLGAIAGGAIVLGLFQVSIILILNC